VIGYVDASVRIHCDWCYTRSPANPHNADVPLKPPRWGVAERDGDTRHACPRHTRQLRAWERGDA
jgi:hypothetical protein